MHSDRHDPLPCATFTREMQADRSANRATREVSCFSASDPLAAQFRVVATIRTGSDQHYGILKVVRRSDKRILFPFNGAPTIGPFPTWTEAHDAALATARKIVEDDLKNPEF
ncbi:DUF6723 family protein [Caballeronia sordidicola]|uniref:DUF6723 family protein n=1 Tax=Caballeronia sordidicola TaxID=196367 RepID=UPI00117EFDF8|nr:DUF6723 family protein [Caballeronia sordidicola]